MKRKKKKLIEEFERLLQEVIPGNYFFSYGQNSINLWWWDRKVPMIDVNIGNGQREYIIDDFSKAPLLILKVLVKELTKREKIKNKIN